MLECVDLQEFDDMSNAKVSANSFGTFLTEFNRAQEKREGKSEGQATDSVRAARRIIEAVGRGNASVIEVMRVTELSVDDLKSALDSLRATDLIKISGVGIEQKIELTVLGQKLAEIYELGTLG